MIKQAQRILETATYSDMDKIRECRAGLIREYALAEQRYGDSFQLYELTRPTVYLETKAKKKNGESKMSDMDIDRFSKKQALLRGIDGGANTYLSDKSYVKVVHEYMRELRDLQINLMHQRKDEILYYGENNDKKRKITETSNA